MRKLLGLSAILSLCSLVFAGGNDRQLFMVKNSKGVILGMVTAQVENGKMIDKRWVHIGSQNGSNDYVAGPDGIIMPDNSNATIATGHPVQDLEASAKFIPTTDHLNVAPHRKISAGDTFYESPTKMMRRAIAVFNDGTIMYAQVIMSPNEPPIFRTFEYVDVKNILLDPPASDPNPPPAPPPFQMPDLQMKSPAQNPSGKNQSSPRVR